MVDVALDRAIPDDEALKSPERQRWCEGITHVEALQIFRDCPSYHIFQIYHEHTTTDHRRPLFPAKVFHTQSSEVDSCRLLKYSR